jgi:hypothetical protein
MSRNLLVDDRGHAYARRVQQLSTGPLRAALVEYDTDLTKVAATPLECQSARKRDPLSASNRDPSGPFVLRC